MKMLACSTTIFEKFPPSFNSLAAEYAMTKFSAIGKTVGGFIKRQGSLNWLPETR